MRLDTFRAYVHARILVIFGYAKKFGLLRAAAKIGARLASLALGLLSSPIALALHLAGFRRLTFVTPVIGHLAAEPDSFLKARALGELPKRRWFFVAPPGRVANEHLLSYWTPHIPVVRNNVACRLLLGMTSLGLMRYDTGRYVVSFDRGQEIYPLNARWGNRSAILSVAPEDAAWGTEMRVALGLPPEAWFVCVHAREGGYAPRAEALHRYRNCDPEALIPAMQEIVARGGWCLRMGDPTTRPLPPLRGVVDYAHHRLRSPRLDVVLCAQARFFLGNTSGLYLVSSVFGRPSLLVNVVPMSGLGVLPVDLNIPKIYWDRRQGRPLRFDEVLGTPAASYRFATQYERAGIELRENSREEILEATKEMLDRLEGCYASAAEDEELQRRFMSFMGPSDYGYGASSRICASFLRKYRHLLPDKTS